MANDTAALVARVKQRYGDPSNAIYSDANFLDYLNDAYRWVLGSMPWGPWKEARTTTLSVTTSGSVALPTDVWRVNAVVDLTNQVQLRPFKSRVQALQQYPVTSGPSNPVGYRLFGQKIELFPTPSSTVTLQVDYMGPQADLGTPTPIPIFPVEHWNVLVEYALYLAYTDDDDVNTAQIHQAAAVIERENLETELSIDRTEGNPVLVDDWYL